MTMTLSMTRKLTLFLLFALAAGGARAGLHVEQGDAGVSIASANVVPGKVVQIEGSIVNVGDDSDVDLYRIVVPSDGPFTIEVLERSAPLDMNLIVFNEEGQGLAGDDDDNNSCDVITELETSLDSCVTLDLAAGVYYIAVGDNNIGAFESEADYEAGTGDFIDNDSGIQAMPTTERLGVVGDEFGPGGLEDEGDYVINFSKALAVEYPNLGLNRIPVMPPWMMALMAVALLLTARRFLKSGRKTAA